MRMPRKDFLRSLSTACFIWVVVGGWVVVGHYVSASLAVVHERTNICSGRVGGGHATHSHTLSHTPTLAKESSAPASAALVSEAADSRRESAPEETTVDAVDVRAPLVAWVDRRKRGNMSRSKSLNAAACARCSAEGQGRQMVRQYCYLGGDWWTSCRLPPLTLMSANKSLGSVVSVATVVLLLSPFAACTVCLCYKVLPDWLSAFLGGDVYIRFRVAGVCWCTFMRAERSESTMFTMSAAPNLTNRRTMAEAAATRPAGSSSPHRSYLLVTASQKLTFSAQCSPAQKSTNACLLTGLASTAVRLSTDAMPVTNARQKGRKLWQDAWIRGVWSAPPLATIHTHTKRDLFCDTVVTMTKQPSPLTQRKSLMT